MFVVLRKEVNMHFEIFKAGERTMATEDVECIYSDEALGFMHKAGYSIMIDGKPWVPDKMSEAVQIRKPSKIKNHGAGIVQLSLAGIGK
jgi:hypothetical protein